MDPRGNRRTSLEVTGQEVLRGWAQASHTGRGGSAPCCCPGAGGVSEGKPLLSLSQAPSGADRGQAPGNRQTGQEDAHAAWAAPPGLCPWQASPVEPRWGAHNPTLKCSRQPLPRKQSPLVRWDQSVVPQIPWPCHAFLLSTSSCAQWAGPLLRTLDRRRRHERVGAAPRQGPVESRAGVTVPLRPPPLHCHPVPSFP